MLHFMVRKALFFISFTRTAIGPENTIKTHLGLGGTNVRLVLDRQNEKEQSGYAPSGHVRIVVFTPYTHVH